MTRHDSVSFGRPSPRMRRPTTRNNRNMSELRVFEYAVVVSAVAASCLRVWLARRFKTSAGRRDIDDMLNALAFQMGATSVLLAAAGLLGAPKMFGALSLAMASVAAGAAASPFPGRTIAALRRRNRR